MTPAQAGVLTRFVESLFRFVRCHLRQRTTTTIEQNLQLRDSAGLDRLRRFHPFHPGNGYLSRAYSIATPIPRLFQKVKFVSSCSFQNGELEALAKTAQETQYRCADE